MSGVWSAERMRDLGRRHARVEAARQLEALMETLVDEPVYEFHTLGLRLRGGARIRRYYRQFFDDYLSKVSGGERLGEWVSERAYVLESAIQVRGARGPELHQVMSVLWAQGERLGGERIYAGEHVVRAMAGSLFAELEPIPRTR